MSQASVPATRNLYWRALAARRGHGLAARRWHDGDTMLIFAAFCLILLGALAWRIADPGNWIILPETAVETVAQDCGQGNE